MNKITNVFWSAALFLSLFGSVQAESYQDLPVGFKHKWEHLLHYAHGQSSISADSDFFLSDRGAFSPSEELLATIDLMSKQRSESGFYPARAYLLGETSVENQSEDFIEYGKYIAVEKVYLVFASEAVTSPVSSMGHLFLVIEGKNYAGILKKHAVAFVADTHLTKNLLWGFATASIVGQYVLNPYDDLIYDYVSKEGRTLWEYELTLTPEEKKWLFLHLYELKSHKIRYSFFAHNCSTGLNRLLSVASEDFYYPRDLFYVTPVEYVKHIRNSGRVAALTIRPSQEDRVRLEKNLLKEPTEASNTSKVSLGYRYSAKNGGALKATFLPVSHDLDEDRPWTSVLNANKFLETTLVVKTDRVLIDEFSLVKIRSLPNIEFSGPKFNGSIQFHGKHDEEHTALYPDISLGTAFSYAEDGLRPYLAVDAGVHWDEWRANFYLLGEAGAYFTHPDTGRFLAKFIKPAASKGNYRGYRSAFEMGYFKSFGDFGMDLKLSVYRTNEETSPRWEVGFNYRF